MNKFINLVEKFQNTTQSSIIKLPSEDQSLTQLRIDLLQEELNEFKEACSNNDRVEMLDALLDLQYILFGTALTFQLDDNFEEGFLRVHESNMSKFPKTVEERRDTMLNYAKAGINTITDKKEGFYIVKRISDNKILKSINYNPVDLTDLV